MRVRKNKESTMDMDELMAHANALQENVAAAQDKLAQMHVKGIAENGA